MTKEDWDINLIKQRANPWGKRLQLLHRVHAFIGHFDKYFESKYGRQPEIVMEYHNLLNFLPNFHLIGQKPSVWWTRLHDIDLLVGTFRHGYAMYDKMRACEEFGFAELEKSKSV
jgi:hypothetical protein